MITLLNTSILTDFGSYTFKPITLDYAREMVSRSAQCGGCGAEYMFDQDHDATCISGGNDWRPVFQSAIGHESTAQILSELLGVDVPVNRIDYKQQPGETAIVFKLRGRAPEGTILNREQIEAIGYDFGLLLRNDGVAPNS